MKGMICCLLKAGGDFIPAHAEWLRKQCAEKMPDWKFLCWSDMEVTGAIPLEYGWPKWWGKFQIYRDTAKRHWLPALVIDLDTVFLDELKILPEHADKSIFLRDVWQDGTRKPERLGGGFSYLPRWARVKLWDAFSAEPETIMKRFSGDDQPFLHSIFSETALRWQDHYLDQVMSYKGKVKYLGVNEDTKVVYFHGIPRPWSPDLSEPWIPRFNSETKQPSEIL